MIFLDYWLLLDPQTSNTTTATRHSEHCIDYLLDQTQQESVEETRRFLEYRDVTKSSRRVEVSVVVLPMISSWILMFQRFILQMALILFSVLFMFSLLATFIGTLHLLDHLTIFKQFNSFTCPVQ